MQDSKDTTYEVAVRGLWTVRHRVTGPEGELGVLTERRNRFGRIDVATWRPTKGEVLEIRRQPGILRAQFMVWTEGKEWLGASLRWSFLRRDIEISTPTGAKPYRLIPSAGLGRGWRLLAPRTGEVARVQARPLRRARRIEVSRRVDVEILLFAYMLTSLSMLESIWPGPELDTTGDSLAAARGA